MDTSPDRADVKSRAKTAYEVTETIWPDTDAWSAHTKQNIGEFVGHLVDRSSATILNAGCGGNDYSLSANWVVNLDISLRQCQALQRAVVGDIETIPFTDNHFDVVICVGAVLNYSEPYSAIPELIRVTKPSGLIIVDFETTHTAELLFSRDWGKRVSVIERDYAGRLDKTFLFSTYHISRILYQFGAEIVTTRYYHTATALWRRIFPEAMLPKHTFSSDKLVSRIPGLRTLASNVIFACRKR
jgi:ubiquinone/menaquinone biosynthesis C-methylase UbiE